MNSRPVLFLQFQFFFVFYLFLSSMILNPAKSYSNLQLVCPFLLSRIVIINWKLCASCGSWSIEHYPSLYYVLINNFLSFCATKRVKLIIEEIEREEAALREDLYSADRKFAEYYNVCEEVYMRIIYVGLSLFVIICLYRYFAPFVFFSWKGPGADSWCAYQACQRFEVATST